MHRIEDSVSRASSGSLAERLRRPVGTGSYVPEIDGLRFVAIASVVTFHLSVLAGLGDGRYAPPYAFGAAIDTGTSSRARALVEALDVGVPVFFAISGFVLALPFIRWRMGVGPPVRIARYFARRLTRIEPPFIAAMLLSFVLATLLGQSPGFASLAATLGYQHLAWTGQVSSVNGVTWSLDVEAQWYLIVPLVAVLFSSRSRIVRWWAATSVVLLGWIFEATVGSSSAPVQNVILQWISFFIVGWMVADVFLTRGFGSRSRWWDVVVAVAGVSLLVVAGPLDIERTLAPPLIGVMLIGAFRGTSTSRVLRKPWICVVGGMCYSIYLVHYPIFLGTRSLVGGPPASWPLPASMMYWAAVTLPITALAALAFYVVIERPCMDAGWFDRVRSRVRSLAAPIAIRPTRSTMPVVLPAIPDASVEAESRPSGR